MSFPLLILFRFHQSEKASTSYSATYNLNSDYIGTIAICIWAHQVLPTQQQDANLGWSDGWWKTLEEKRASSKGFKGHSFPHLICIPWNWLIASSCWCWWIQHMYSGIQHLLNNYMLCRAINSSDTIQHSKAAMTLLATCQNNWLCARSHSFCVQFIVKLILS